jgi:hypothetical protein
MPAELCPPADEFIGLRELIINKRAAGREKDLADVAALESDELS